MFVMKASSAERVEGEHDLRWVDIEVGVAELAEGWIRIVEVTGCQTLHHPHINVGRSQDLEHSVGCGFDQELNRYRGFERRLRRGRVKASRLSKRVQRRHHPVPLGQL